MDTAAITGAAPMKSPDQEMVRECLRGNESAWEDLIRFNERRIFTMGYRFTRCRAEADDLTQEVFLRAYQTLSSFRAESGSLSGWLIHIARNLLIDRYRKARRNVRCAPIEEEELSVDDPGATSPLQCLARNEIEMMVRAALRRLAPGNRIVIVLHDLKGLALQEVAAILRIPVGTVKSRMIRGRRDLARILRCPSGRQPGGDQYPEERVRRPLESAGHCVPRECPTGA